MTFLEQRLFPLEKIAIQLGISYCNIPVNKGNYSENKLPFHRNFLPFVRHLAFFLVIPTFDITTLFVLGIILGELDLFIGTPLFSLRPQRLQSDSFLKKHKHVYLGNIACVWRTYHLFIPPSCSKNALLKEAIYFLYDSFPFFQLQGTHCTKKAFLKEKPYDKAFFSTIIAPKKALKGNKWEGVIGKHSFNP